MKTNILKSIASTLLFMFLCTSVYGQIIDPEEEIGGGNASVFISGSSTANVNDTKSYTALVSGATVFAANWSISSGGIILSQNSNTVTIKWTSAGARIITYNVTNSTAGFIQATKLVSVSASSAPPTPSTPSISSQNCTGATLQRGTPPVGVTWYWQGTNSSGTSTSNSFTNYTVSSSGTYYLRARSSSGVWSTGSAARTVTLGTVGGSTWYADSDGDGLGDPNSTLVSCSQPSGYVSNSNDQCPSAHGGGNSNGCPSTTSLSNENYVHTIAPQIAVDNISQISDSEDLIESVTYFDGLGRSKQSIAIRAGSQEEDIVTHVEYDEYGRMAKEYLPYAQASNNGSFLSNAKSSTNSFYNSKYGSDLNTSNPNPFSEKAFEASPLNRVLKQAAPGNDWRMGGGHEIEMEYHSNVANEVRYYDVTLTRSVSNTVITYNPSLVDNGFYNASELYKTITKDENHTGTSKNHTTEEFKDKMGRIILKRTYNAEVAHDTYYVYDDHGNLSYVLSPKVDTTEGVDATELAELCYQYKYDNRNRLVEKKIPGKGWEYIVYNKLDQPVMTQDANLKAQGKWLVTKYDAFGRVAFTGIINNGNSRITLQNAANDTSTYEQYVNKTSSAQSIAGTTIYYTNLAIPHTMHEIHTINYYDNYTFDKDGLSLPGSVYGVSISSNTKGLATGSKVRILGTNNWITTLTGYDAKGRVIYAISKNNYLGTTDIVETKLDFVGKIDETTTRHTYLNDSRPTIITVDKFYYDHVARLTKQTQRIGSGSTEVIVENTYDEIGQLESKGVGGKTTQSRLQNVDYTYNIRGWLKQINNPSSLGADLFGFKINYNEQETLVSGAIQYDDLFNGNISQTIWKTANDNIKRGYSYSYDDLNRIQIAIIRKGDALNSADIYSIWGINYDKNGNINSLLRQGHINAAATSFGTMDNLVYTYASRSNKLVKVLDNGNDNFGFKDGANTSTEYTYDANGNMLRDYNKGISSNISYNHLNLPTQVNLSGGNIQYIYDATGIKQKKIVSNGSTTVYAGNYIYEKPNIGSETLKFFNHQEGYVEPNGLGFKYVYQYKDHIGNIRLSYADDNNNGSVNSSEIREENNYYPFGLKHKGYNDGVSAFNNGVASRWKYNGKELNEELGLNWYDYGARHYDAALGRFMVIDRYSEEFEFQSPYTYAANNPVIFIDKNGDGPILGILGALAGAVVETVSQVAGAVATGSSFSDAVNNLDFADIGIAAVEGGLAGLTNGASLLVTNKVADVAQAAIDVNGNGEVSTIFGGANGGDKKDLGQAAVEVVVGRTVGEGAKKLGKVANEALDKSIKKQSSNLTAKSKNLTKSNNVVANGNTNSKAKSPNEAFKEFSVAKDKVLETKSVKNAINSKTGEKVGDVAKSVTGSAIKEGANTVKEKIQE